MPIPKNFVLGEGVYAVSNGYQRYREGFFYFYVFLRFKACTAMFLL